MDESHLLDIVNSLLSDPAYAVGDRRVPWVVTREEAVAVASRLAETIDRGVVVRDEKAGAAGLTIACRAGCTACCEQPILVWLPEVLLVVEWLARPEHAEILERFLERYPAWRAAVGDSFDSIADATAAQDLDAYQQAHLAGWRRRVLCAFNQDGLCTIYPVRPQVCRTHHAVGTAEHCVVDAPSGRLPARAAFTPLDDFRSRARLVSSALHHALGGARMRALVLCREVAERAAAR